MKLSLEEWTRLGLNELEWKLKWKWKDFWIQKIKVLPTCEEQLIKSALQTLRTTVWQIAYLRNQEVGKFCKLPTVSKLKLRTCKHTKARFHFSFVRSLVVRSLEFAFRSSQLLIYPLDSPESGLQTLVQTLVRMASEQPGTFEHSCVLYRNKAIWPFSHLEEQCTFEILS